MSKIVKAYTQHKKKAALVDDNGNVFVLQLLEGRTVEKLITIVEAGDSFVPAVDFDPVKDKSWVEHNAKEKQPFVKVALPFRVSACYRSAGHYYYKVVGKELYVRVAKDFVGLHGQRITLKHLAGFAKVKLDAVHNLKRVSLAGLGYF